MNIQGQPHFFDLGPRPFRAGLGISDPLKVENCLECLYVGILLKLLDESKRWHLSG